MTKRADPLHHNIAPAHSTALVRAFLAKHHITQVCQHPYSTDLAFHKAKIAVEREDL
jgi:hypothetical protein